MAVLESNSKQQIYSSTLLTSLLIAAVVFSGLLIFHSIDLSNSTGTVVGAFGPLKLFEITKTQVAGGGYSGGFKLLQTGSISYFGTWIVFGFCWATLRTKTLRAR